ncbi:hypothetical protein C8J57DRAFT_1564694 [Mycena rebaudengoi]|nr:hypothetical protein C8J57DRAFT_1564694 [Mycena rebaudengoi]
MPSLLPPEYLLLALFLESIFWGINAVTLGFCLEALSRKSTSSASPSSYQTARRIVIDSGLMHTTVATATAIVYICGSNGYAALTGIDVQMIAISFNLILIRVHQKRAAALRQCSDFERPPASTLRFGVLHRTSPSADTALGDLESNHNTRSFGVNSDGILDVSTSSN